MESERDVFFFWLGRIKRRSTEFSEKIENKKFYHASFGDIPPDIFAENDTEINHLPSASNINLENIQKEEVKKFLEKVVLQMQASFRYDQLVKIFWKQTFRTEETSLDKKIEDYKGNEGLFGTETFEPDFPNSDREAAFFDSLNANIPSKMAGHLYWYCKAMHKIADRNPDDKRESDVYRIAAELSEGRTKRTTCEYQMKDSESSFIHLFNTAYNKYFDDQSETYKETLLRKYIKRYVNQVEALEN